MSKIARTEYVKKVLSFVRPEKFKKLKMVVNFGNGAAGPTFDSIENEISKACKKLDIIKIFHKPDHSFPNGIPNPMLKKNHKVMQKAILKSSADLGIAFDGDFDRCFFFDDFGEFIPGEIIIGILAKVLTAEKKNEVIVHDPRLIWLIQNVVKVEDCKSILSRTGHVFLKEKMRAEQAIYGGEISGHHYFREFSYCDSGMLPWLIFIQFLSTQGMPLSQIVKENKESFKLW